MAELLRLAGRLLGFFVFTRCVECGARVAGDSIGYVFGRRCLLHFYYWYRSGLAHRERIIQGWEGVAVRNGRLR